VFTLHGTRLNLQPGTSSDLQTAPSIVHISISIFATILYIGFDSRIGRLCYTAVHSVVMDQLGLKRIGVCVLKHYCNSKKCVHWLVTL